TALVHTYTHSLHDALPICERYGDRGGNQHHSGNGTDPENQQVRDREGRNANRGEYEKSNRSGTSEAVNDANYEWTKHLIKSDARSEEHTSELQSPDHLVCR